LIFKYHKVIVYYVQFISTKIKKHAVGVFSIGIGLDRIVDVSGNNNKERAKGLLSILQRNGCIEGTTEFVASGSRFKDN